jgi:CheY-like chemotaxis protein
LRQTVDAVVQLLRVQAAAKGLGFHSKISPRIPLRLGGDANRLRQVLTNLTANAIKFTERGEVMIEAALDRLDQVSATIRFTIADTGIGIRQDQVGALFSPFTQADASTTRQYGGSGLGLAISKQLVEMMGGTIGVDSQEGRGSSFWFTVVCELLPEGLPLPGAQGGGMAPRGAALPAAARAASRILVAEDNATNREVALAQLQMLGYQADAVNSGAEAVAAIERGCYGLVLMDCEMPVMDGFEATRIILGPGKPRIPIVAVTADAMPADRDRCLSAGMCDYISKPVELENLAAVLTKWLAVPGANGIGRSGQSGEQCSVGAEKLP